MVFVVALVHLELILHLSLMRLFGAIFSSGNLLSKTLIQEPTFDRIIVVYRYIIYGIYY